MEIQGREYLNGPDTVRDGALVAMSVVGVNSEPTIELVFETRTKSTVTIELRDVQEFDFNYVRENAPSVVEFLKCRLTDDGDFYLSLDPSDEREGAASPKDKEYFRSKLVKLTTA